MADRDSASESDSSSIDGGPIMMPPSPITREQLQKRIDSLQQQNRVLKVELDTYKLRVKALQEENRNLRQASVIIQAKAEQEEEFISNTLLKKIQALKKEKETLAHHYEQEEECLTNDLSRKLLQLRQEKCKLEQTLEQEQECLVNKLMRKIEKLESETLSKQTNLEQLRREKVKLENTLEQEQESLVNRLWKRMDKLENEKRTLQIKLDQPVSDPASPRDISNGEDTASNISSHIQILRNEVMNLRSKLETAEKENTKKSEKFAKEERQIREENMRLRKKLQMEMDRRIALCRSLSESESSLEMDEERHTSDVGSSGIGFLSQSYNASSPLHCNPVPSTSPSRSISPGVNTAGVMRSRENSYGNGKCYACGQTLLTSLQSVHSQLQVATTNLSVSQTNSTVAVTVSNNSATLQTSSALSMHHNRSLNAPQQIQKSAFIKPSIPTSGCGAVPPIIEVPSPPNISPIETDAVSPSSPTSPAES